MNEQKRKSVKRKGSIVQQKCPAVERYCVYCGCTDTNGCAGGCSWVVRFPDITGGNPAGICSSVTCLQQFFNDFGRTAKNLAKYAGYL